MKNRIYLSKQRIVKWWRAMDKRHAWWRTANVAAVVVLILSSFTPYFDDILAQRAYALSDDSRKLVGDANADLAGQLIYNPKENTYLFNVSAQKSDDANPAAALQAQVGSSTGKDGDKSLYSLDISAKFADGVKYHDVNSGLEFTMKPQFGGMEGKVVDDHLVFPIGGDKQAIYTLKGNGLKEDIVVQHVQSDTLQFSYQLNLPKTLQARMIPDGNGAIGIYAADPSLYSNMQYGSDADRAAVEQARETGEKNYLVFGLPAPVSRDLSDRTVGHSKFVLDGDKLTVVVDGIADVKGPITVDPSVVVTSSSDFQMGGNDEGMIDFSTSGQVARGGLTGGEVGSWSSTTSLTTAMSSNAPVAYNGYLYIIGGDDSYGLNDVQYAKINTDGTVGTWLTTTSFTTARYQHTSVVYNGYLYVIGGIDNSSTVLNDVQYAKINGDGTVGAWLTTTSFTTARRHHTSVVYDGYLYVIGGYGGSYLNDVQYAKIQPPGYTTPFSFASNNFSTSVALDCSVAYNGYIYKIGGSTVDGPTKNVATVQYAALDNVTGDIGTWSSTTSLPQGRGSAGCTVYNGRLYVAGGKLANTGSDTKSIIYATINSSGTLGAWTTSPNQPAGNNAGRSNKPGLFTYTSSGGTYLYIVGGCTVISDGTCGTVAYSLINDSDGSIGVFTDASNSMVSSYVARAFALVGDYLYAIGGDDTSDTGFKDTEYAKIQGDGSVGTWTSTAQLPSVRDWTSATTVSGCIYVLGGEAAGSVAQKTNYYACPSSDGSISSWNTMPSLVIAMTDMGVTSYNGYIYGVGGYTDANNVVSSTEYAEVNGVVDRWSDYLGAWSTNPTSFTTARYGHTSVIYGGYLYVIGGVTGNDLVQYAKINADGTLGTWSNTTSFTTSRYGHTSIVYNGYLYVIGGYSGTATLSDVQYAKINADGTLGTWSNTTSLTVARDSHTSVVYNGYLYVIGGVGITYLSDVQYAKINADGTLGTWQTTTRLPATRYGHTSVIYNGYLYVIGGDDSSGNKLNDVQCAKINADGTVGTWSATTSFTTARDGHTSVVYNGYLYVIGGSSSGSSYLNDIQYSKINRGRREGLYSKLIDLGSSYKITGITYNGSVADGDVAINYRTAGANAVFGNTMQLSDLSGSGGGASACPLPSELARYIWISVTLGPDDYLTDLTVSYSSIHPSPDIRLRGGKTLQQSQGLSAFDTCGP